MVGSLLRLPEPPTSDHAADALAVAICHASHAPPQRGRSRFAGAPAGAGAALRTEAEAG
jgi:hypothetical protein